MKYINQCSLGLGATALLLFPTFALSAQLEEVVVTAQKRTQSLQDVSLAVSAVGGKRLSDGLIGNIEDFQAMIPSVSIGSDFAQAKLFVRGIGLNSSFAGVDPSVALHVDGAVISQSYAQLGSFFDLERIEVLRGPQGTLYGRNATGGSFNLITRKPTEDLEGYGRLTLGDYDQVLLEGAVSGPLSDNIKGRVAFKSESRSGYGENTFTGNDIDDAHKQSARIHLQFDLNDNIDLLLSAEWANEDDAGLSLKFVEAANALDPNLAGPPGVGGFASNVRNIASEVDPQNDRTTWAINAALSWSIDDNWTLKSITNYRDLDVLLVQDLDISSNFNDDVQSNLVESEQFSEELQLHFDNDRLHGLMAIFYFNEQMINRNNIGFASSNINTGGFPLFANTQAVLFTADVDIESWAFFANFTYDITENFALKLGGRYSYENRDADTLRLLNFTHFGPAATNIAINFSDERSFNDFSPTIGLDWHPTEDILLYVSYSEGFKSGTIQGGQVTEILEPEEIENYEVGIKGTFFDGRLQLNAAAFYYEFTDLQLDRSRPGPNGSFVSIFENAAEAEGEGVELEATWLVSEEFKLGGYVSVLDTEFGEYITDNPLDNGVNFQNLEGNSLRQAPELTWGARGEYEMPLASGALVVFGVDAAYKDEQYFTEFNQDIVGEDDYTIVNANVKYVSPSEKFFVNIWGKNLTDEEVYGGKFVIATGLTIGGTLLPPVTWGVTVGYDF